MDGRNGRGGQTFEHGAAGHNRRRGRTSRSHHRVATRTLRVNEAPNPPLPEERPPGKGARRGRSASQSSLAMDQGERPKFRNVEPRSRQERLANNDKEMLEKLRLEHRRGGAYRYDNPGNIIQPPEDSAAFISEGERFGTNAAQEEYENRRRRILEREVRAVPLTPNHRHARVDRGGRARASALHRRTRRRPHVPRIEENRTPFLGTGDRNPSDPRPTRPSPSRNPASTPVPTLHRPAGVLRAQARG